MKHTGNQDHQGYQLINVKAEIVASLPAHLSSFKGRFVYLDAVDSTKGLYVATSTSWEQVGSGGGGGATNFVDLEDVDASDLEDGYFPVWNDAEGKLVTQELPDGVVTEGKIADNAVSTDKIEDDAVTNDKIANNAINTNEIVNNAVVESKIADDAVTTDKIADLAITTGKINDLAITNAKVANTTLTEGKFTLSARAGFPLRFVDDAAFEAVLTPQEGDYFWGTAENKYRVYNGSVWGYFTDGINNAQILVTPSEGTVSPWTPASNPTFVDSETITIDIDGTIEDKAIIGAPVRFGTSIGSWKYGYITGVTVNITDIELVIAGIAMTAPTVAFFQVGSANVLKTTKIVIPGTQAVGNDREKVVNKSVTYWLEAKAFVVGINAVLDTAANGANYLLNVAVGSVGNTVLTSDLNLGQDANLHASTDNIDEDNYEINYQEKIFINTTQIGSVVAGSDLTVFILSIVNEQQHVQYIPVGFPQLPFGYSGGGGSGNSGTPSITNDIEYLSIDTNTGGSSNYGDLTVARNSPTSKNIVSESYIHFNGGHTNTSFEAGSTVSDVIDRIDSNTVTGICTDKGDLVTACSGGSSVQGEEFGITAGGATTASVATNNIEAFDINTATEDAVSNGDLTQSKSMLSGASGNDSGLVAGGKTTPNSPGSAVNVIEKIGVTAVNNVVAADHGDLGAAVCNLFSFGWRDQDLAFFLCGRGATLIANNIERVDITTSSTTLDKGDSSTSRCNGSSFGGEFYGNMGGGYTDDVFGSGVTLMDIDIFDYTTGTVTTSDRADMQAAKWGAGASS